MAGIQEKGGYRLNPRSGIVQQPRCVGGKIGSGFGSKKYLFRFNPGVNPAPFQFPYRAVYARLPRPHTETIMTFAQRRPA